MKDIFNVFPAIGDVLELHLTHQWLRFRFMMFRLPDVKKTESKK